MKIVIHGTKGGHHTFTDEKVEMIDARPDSSKVAAIGREAYAINFNDGNVIFSKYKIVRDVAGEKRTGHIAFSVIVPNKERLSGSNVKSLLDELAEYYCNKYIENNNLDNIREDWQFVDEISSKFIKDTRSAPTRAIENFQQGTEEAAFIYYSSDDDLQNYFAVPYQDNYKRFKQIFFVDEKFESKPENPLNALRHNPSSDLTKRINVQNRKYTLLFDEKNIKVKENGVERKNDSRVHIESKFEIVYSEPHHETISISGLVKEIKDYISIDIENETIAIQKRNLESKKYTFNFITTDQNSNSIDDAEIMGKRLYQNQEDVLSNPFIATYEVSREYIVYAKKEPNLISTEKSLKDYFISSDPSMPIDVNLFLKKRPKEIRIIVQEKESGENISEFTVRNEKNKEIDVSNGKIKISGDEIDKNITILVERPGYESSREQFIPEKGESITIMLKKKTARISPNADKKTILVIIFGLISLFAMAMAIIDNDAKIFSFLKQKQEEIYGIDKKNKDENVDSLINKAKCDTNSNNPADSTNKAIPPQQQQNNSSSSKEISNSSQSLAKSATQQKSSNSVSKVVSSSSQTKASAQKSSNSQTDTEIEEFLKWIRGEPNTKKEDYKYEEYQKRSKKIKSKEFFKKIQNKADFNKFIDNFCKKTDHESRKKINSLTELDKFTEQK